MADCQAELRSQRSCPKQWERGGVSGRGEEWNEKGRSHVNRGGVSERGEESEEEGRSEWKRRGVRGRG